MPDAVQLLQSYSATIDMAHNDMVAKVSGVAPGSDDAKRFNDELLAKYQVKPDGVREWPDWPLSLVTKPQELTYAEIAMIQGFMVREDTAGLLRFKNIKESAEAAAETAFGGKGIQDGHADAFRHAYWNALMTKEYGEPFANDYGTAHERHPGSSAITVAMDLHNNEVGRQLALANPRATDDEMKGLIEKAITDGRMVVIDRNDMLVPSNSLNPGDTRLTDDAHPWPDTNPERADDRDPGPPTAQPEHY